MIDELIKESPILREELIEEGIERGLEKGILRTIRRRFDRVPDEMAELTDDLNTEQLELLLDAVIFLPTLEAIMANLDELRLDADKDA